MTAEEFISLLEVEKQSAHEVLRPQVHPEILKYLVGGMFDDSRKRLIAYALMPVNKDYFWKYDYILKFSESHSAVLFNLKGDQKRSTGVYHPDSGIGEKIEKGYYKNNLVSFTCEYDFNDWNILTWSCFTNTKDQSQIIKTPIDSIRGTIKSHFFESSIFKETTKHYEDFGKHTEHEYKMDVPYKMLPYIGHSHLVALIRTRKKGEVNNAYTDYIQKAFFEPLMIKLKTLYPNAYKQTNPFSPFRHNLLFPEHKSYCLFICTSFNAAKKKRLSFFVYQQEKNLIYEWIYFPESTYRKHKLDPFDLPKIFDPICKVNTWECLSNPECTLDDDDFWNNYVFKKENGKYVYLKELKFD